MNLINVSADAKTIKGEKLGWKTGIMYLAPHNVSGKNVCAFASKGCAAACLFTSGRGKFKNVHESRIKKTKYFISNPKEFVEALRGEIYKLKMKFQASEFELCIRLNGTSDLPWERLGGNSGVSVVESFPTINFYDYTKNPNRMMAYLKGDFPKNYHLTFSRSESNNAVCDKVLQAGGSVAIVFDELPESYNGFEVTNGDESDLRFLDPVNCIVGLKAKGKAKNDSSGFTIITK